MANLKEIRNRISSVSSTMQITSAMKMVSAAKLKKAQDAITAMRPYSDKLTELLQSLSATLDEDAGSKFAEQREINNVLIVSITSNRGLCGAFNSNIIKEVNRLTAETYANQEVSYLAIGKKANDAFKKTNRVIANKSEIFDDLTFDNVAAIAELLMEKFVAGDFDKIEIVYNRFKNAAVQILTQEQFLPVKHDDDQHENNDYIFEPTQQYIFETLIPDSLKTQLFTAITDSYAAEQGARMTAMHQATDNASEMIKSLTLSYNKARQASITKEINEISAGAEALNG